MSAGSSSPIVVRALEAELAKSRNWCHAAEREFDSARVRLNVAEQETANARKNYDAVEGELEAAKLAVLAAARMSVSTTGGSQPWRGEIRVVAIPGYGDVALNTTDNGESAPAGRCAP